MSLDSGFKSFIEGNKKLWKIGVIVALGVILRLVSSAFNSDSGENAEKNITLKEYKAELEAELSDLCGDVKGVGRCKVFITFERGEQNTYKGNEIIESKPPKVLGVTVICSGADSDYVKGELTDMITALFDIGANRVAILKLNS